MSGDECNLNNTSDESDANGEAVTGHVTGHTDSACHGQTDNASRGADEQNDQNVMPFDGVLENAQEENGNQYVSGHVYLAKPKRSSDAERQQRSREKKKADGKVRKEYRIYPALHEEIRDYIAARNEEYAAARTGSMDDPS